MKDLVLEFLAVNGYDENNLLAVQYFFKEEEMKPGYMHEVMILVKEDGDYVVKRVVVIDEVIRFEVEDDQLGGSYAYEMCENYGEALENFLCDVEELLEYM